ncbi:MAG: FGGY-family carbohydrate kinase [Oscillospiraceae bacterium]
MAIGGLDIGSTSAKLTVLDRNGGLLYSMQAEYPVSRQAGEHEMNVEDILSAVGQLVRGTAAAVPELTALGVTSFGESFVLLDEEDRPLLPVMLYTDSRGEEEAALLQARPGVEEIAERVGTLPHSMYSLPKLMWIKRNRPDIYGRTKRACLIGEYIVYWLTGNRLLDYSLATRTMGFDIRRKEWDTEAFRAAGINPALFADPVPTGSSAGRILPSLAEELGCPGELQVVLCGHDQITAALGAGALGAGMTTDGGGTVQCLTPVFSEIPAGGFLQRSHYAVIPFPGEDNYCCYAFSFTGGSLIRWFTDGFGERFRLEAERDGITVYDALERQMTDTPTGILTLPHFAGAATPYMDTGSQGAFVGLGLSHSPADLYRSIMEGITYEMRLNRDVLARGGIHIGALNATGGCAKSRLWLQMKADILGIPVTRMGVDDAGTVGSVMLTGVATGAYESMEAACDILVRKLETFFPREEMRRQYDAVYRRYRGLYEAVRPLFMDV